MNWVWVGWIGGGLAGVVVLVLVIGVFLPGYHKVQRTVRYTASADDVWALISDFEGGAEWRTDVSKVERLDDRDGNAVWCEHGSHGAMKVEILQSETARRLVTRLVDNPSLTGGWTWEIAPADSGCELTIIEEADVHNPLFRFVGTFFMDYRATMDGYHRALAARLGEQIELGD